MKYSEKDLMAGFFYKFIFPRDGLNSRVIFVYSGSLSGNNHYINAGNEYGQGSCCSTVDGYFTDPTADEILWLESCIKAERTMPCPTTTPLSSSSSSLIEIYEVY